MSSPRLQRVEVPHSTGLIEQDQAADDLGWYFDQCEKNRDLLNDIYVVVPVRPNDGINCDLHRKLSVWYGEGTAFSDFNDNMGGYIEVTRAKIAHDFIFNPPENPLGRPQKYLLMIDNDMQPPLNLPYLLARHGKDCVSGCAMSVDEKHGPQLCFSVMDEEGKYRFPTLLAGRAIPSSGLVEAGHAGTGAMLISRHALEQFSFDGMELWLEVERAIAEGSSLTLSAKELSLLNGYECPFITPMSSRIQGMRTGHLLVGEDIHFCNQLRARGIKVYVDLEAHVGHRKSMCLTWDDNHRDPYLDASRWILPSGIGKEIKSR